MAYIKERGNNNYFVRVSCGILDNGRPFQKSRLFRPSRVNLPESKVRKELDAFVKALEEECRIEFESKRQPQTNFELSEGETKHESVEEQVNGNIQSMIAPINSSSTPLFADFCTIYLAAKKENISSTTYLLYPDVRLRHGRTLCGFAYRGKGIFQKERKKERKKELTVSDNA